MLTKIIIDIDRIVMQSAQLEIGASNDEFIDRYDGQRDTPRANRIKCKSLVQSKDSISLITLSTERLLSGGGFCLSCNELLRQSLL